MGVLDRVKGLVFEESEEEVKEQEAQETDSEETSPKPVQKKTVRPAAAIDDEFYRELKSDVDADSPQAYRSFMAKLQSLADLGLTRAKIVKAAFKTSGVTKANLIAALQGRKQLLNKEQIEFESALDSQTRDEIEAREQQAVNLGNNLTDQEAELKRITDRMETEIASLKSQKQELETAVAKGRKQQEKAKSRFSGARQKLENEIDTEIKEISSLLEGE